MQQQRQEHTQSARAEGSIPWGLQHALRSPKLSPNPGALVLQLGCQVARCSRSRQPNGKCISWLPHEGRVLKEKLFWCRVALWPRYPTRTLSTLGIRGGWDAELSSCPFPNFPEGCSYRAGSTYFP